MSTPSIPSSTAFRIDSSIVIFFDSRYFRYEYAQQPENRRAVDAAGVTPSSVAPSRSDALRPAVLAASAVPAAPRNIRREIPLFMSILSSAHGSAATRPALSFYFAQ